MEIIDFENAKQAIQNCREEMRSFAELLSKTAEKISKWYFTDEKTAEEIIDGVQKLKNCTDICISNYRELSNSDDLPIKIDDMEMDIVELEQCMQLNSKRNELISSVPVYALYSDDENLNTTLEELKASFESITKNTNMSYDELETELAPYKTIIEALDTEDSSVKIGLAGGLYSKFNNDIVVGILLGKIHIGDPDSRAAATDEDVKTDEKQENAVPEQKITVADANAPEETEDKELDRELYEKLKKCGVRFEKLNNYDIKVTGGNTAPYKYTSFFNEFKAAGNKQGISWFFELLYAGLPVHADLLAVNGKKSKADAIAKNLITHGYINKISGFFGEYYLLSDKGAALLIDRKARNILFGSKSDSLADSGSINPIDTKDNNAILSAVLRRRAENAISILMGSNNVDVTTTYDSYGFIAFLDSEKHNVFATGMVAPDTDSVKAFSELIEKYNEREYERDKTVVYLGVTLEDAKAVMNFWEQEVFVGGTRIYLYSLETDEIYDPRTGGSVEVDSIDGICVKEELHSSQANTTDVPQNTNETQGTVNKPDTEVSAEPAAPEVIEAVEPNTSVVKATVNPAMQGIDATATPAVPKTVSGTEFTDVQKTEAEIAMTGKVYTGAAIKPERVKSHEEIGITEEEMKKNVYALLIAGKPYCALAYAGAGAVIGESADAFRRRLAYAYAEPAEGCVYSSANLYDVFASEHENDIFDDYCYVAASMRNFFYDDVTVDYEITRFFDTIKNNRVLEAVKPLKEFISRAKTFKANHRKGMDRYTGYRLRNKAQLEEELEKIKRKAADYYHNYIEYPAPEKKSQKRYIETRDSIFGRKSPVSECLSYIREDIDASLADEIFKEINEILERDFIKKGMTVIPENIDNEKIDALIDREWDLAGERVPVNHVTWNLTAGLRNKLINRIKNVASVLCSWVSCMSRYMESGTDKAEHEYKRVIDEAVDKLEEAREEMNAIISGNRENIAESAGAACVRDTIEEFLRRISGNYSADEKKYFYVDFLKNSNVTLDEKYIPDQEAAFYNLPQFSIFERIMEESESEDRSFEERLQEIFDVTDDFGSAKLIEDYLKATGRGDEWNSEFDVEKSEKFARRRIESAFEDFKGNLELYQSYGQIDSIDEKEKILAVVLRWYDASIKRTHNYGFFTKIMDKYKEKIAADANSRKNSVCKQLDNLLKEYKEYSDCEMTAEIRKSIAEQNYTVAEDLIRRLQGGETDNPQIDILNGEDYLDEFYDEYDKNYREAMRTGVSLSAIVQSQSRRNKDTKGSTALIENWIRGAGTSENRIKNLLLRLGFDVIKVEKKEKIGKFDDNFKVSISDSHAGKLETYPHPVAAFGSEAKKNGFRVLCGYGTTTGERLIEELRGINDNTIVLLDYALATAERRKIAKMFKQQSGGKVFLVIDRVMIMYLANHYEDSPSIMNRKLMMTALPFSYYQPYVSESSMPMPPEMFIGRERELEAVKNPKGANMIFGGRQLGKSALLKKAKSDVELNEKGERAILVNLQYKDYKGAARCVSQALIDKGILEPDCECDNWDELGRHIRLRLDSERHKDDNIPFLLLMMDEADEFLRSAREINYEPFKTLKELQSDGEGKFKFVIAGLRDLVKFHNDSGNNNPMLHMAPIAITPFNGNEAVELLEKPLMYFGMRFPKEKNTLVSLILATTNYFPGLIQMYCRKLIEAFRENDYAGYREAQTPPYEIDVRLIKKILSDKEFLEEVNKKFEWTLRLDNDDYYFVLAMLMCYLYNEEGYEYGKSAEKILETACEYNITRISKLGIGEVKALMDELKGLNVFRCDDSGKYLFTRHNFYQMLRSSYDIDDELEKYMEGC